MPPEVDSRLNVYSEGARVVYRASSVGGCLRALVAARLGYSPLPFDDDAELRMAEGVLHEPAVIEHLEKAGWTITDEQREVELTIGDQLVIRGHVDGIGHRSSTTRRVVEIKAMGDDPFKEWIARGFEANPRYASQLSVYMAGLDMPGLMVVKNRNSGRVHVTEVDELPVPIFQLKARVARVEAIARSGGFPDCDTTITWGCPYRYLHEEVSLPHRTVDDTEVDALAAAYDRARASLQQAETLKRLARDRLADVVRDRGKVRTKDWSVSCSLQKRTSVDMAKLRAEIDVSPYEVTTELETVRVTAVKSVDA